MLTRLDLTDRPSAVGLAGVLPRAAVDLEAVTHLVRPTLEAVRARGADAVREATLRFDGVRLTDLRVPAAALAEAAEALDPAVAAALTEAIRRIRVVHEAQLPPEKTVQVVPGGTVTRRHLPVGRVGLYVPGGLAPLPSSVLMNVIPAQVAGVTSIAVASPPRAADGGLPDRTVLAACHLLGVEEVYAVGGAQAIALLAYGADGVEPVDLVTGPGNVYVTAAKRLLRGVVGIDSEAGPSEVMVVADATADPELIAADLLSQAEHGPTSASVLVTESVSLADAVDVALEAQVAATRHVDRVTEALTGPQSRTVLVRDLDQALEVADAYAAEHLEIQTADAATVARRVRNAGCVFVGPHSPVSLGDYAAGSNHVLPTGGSCRHTAGLSTETFLRGVNLVEYDEAALRGIGEHVVTLAYAEDLPAHAERDHEADREVTGLDELPLRDDLRGRVPYGAPQLDVPVRLNTNENSSPLPAALLADIAVATQAVAGTLNRYPDRDAVDLRADLARYLGVDPAQVWAANGSNEILQQLLQTFGGPGRTALGFTPSYSMHEIIATGTGTRWLAGHRGADFTVTPDDAATQVAQLGPDVVFLTSPNNPTGTALPLETVEAVLAVAPGMVVVDEAYAEFARPGVPSALTLLPGHPRLVVTRTMSKAFGMAGLRLGYLAADPAVVDAVQLVRLPYHLSALTQAVARVALAHAPALLASVEAIKGQRDRIVAALPAAGLTSVPSDANFVLFGPFADAGAAWQAFLDRGVLVRDPGIPGWLRVTAGVSWETDAFLSAVREVAAL